MHRLKIVSSPRYQWVVLPKLFQFFQSYWPYFSIVYQLESFRRIESLQCDDTSEYILRTIAIRNESFTN